MIKTLKEQEEYSRFIAVCCEAIENKEISFDDLLSIFETVGISIS